MWTFYDKFQTALKAGPMFLRGLLIKPFIGRSAGTLFIGKGVRIRNPKYLICEGRAIFEDYCEVQGMSLNGIHIGDKVTIGSFAQIRPSGYYNRDKGQGFKIGNNSNIGPFAYIGCGGGVHIGSDVMMAPHVTIHSENHIFSSCHETIKSQGVTKDLVTIEDDVWLATGCRIMSGVTIGKGAIIAAGAVVTKNVPEFAIMAGVPAKQISSRKKN